jgi:release factor glutamine methyltransferase
MSEAAAEWTIGRLIEWTRQFFEKKGIPQPRLEAEILLAHVLGAERIALYMRYDQPVDDDQRNQFRDLVKRRADREPTRYLVGVCEFLSLAMKVTSACLIPRPETEQLVEETLRLAGVRKRLPHALGPVAEDYRPVAPAAAAGSAPAPEAVPPSVSVIELCTGCGCIAVSLAASLPQARVTATDLSAEALEVARTNAEAHGVADRVALLAGDLYQPLDAADVRPADFLLANPPYVAEAEWAGLEPEIVRHEPRGALVAGPKGTEIIDRILKGAPAYLNPGGRLLLEIGSGQGEAVRALAADVRGLEGVEVLKDYAGHDRILVARKGDGR